MFSLIRPSLKYTPRINQPRKVIEKFTQALRGKGAKPLEHLVQQFEYFRIIVRAWSNRYCTRLPSTTRGEKARERKKGGPGKSQGKGYFAKASAKYEVDRAVQFAHLFGISSLCNNSNPPIIVDVDERGKKTVINVAVSHINDEWTIVLRLCESYVRAVE